MSKQWTIENDTGAELTVRAPNGFCVELDANSYDPRERFAYFAIRQQARDLEQLRARLASPAHAHLDGEHLIGMVDGCLLCQAITERDQLRADLAAVVAERDRLRDSDAFSRRELARGNEIIDGLRIERDQLRARLSAIDAAPTLCWQDVHDPSDLYWRRPDPAQVDTRELIARPAKD